MGHKPKVVLVDAYLLGRILLFLVPLEPTKIHMHEAFDDLAPDSDSLPKLGWLKMALWIDLPAELRVDCGGIGGGWANKTSLDHPVSSSRWAKHAHDSDFPKRLASPQAPK